MPVAAKIIAASVSHYIRIGIAGQTDPIFLTQFYEIVQTGGRYAFQKTEPTVLHFLPSQVLFYKFADFGTEILGKNCPVFKIEDDAFLAVITNKLTRVHTDFGKPAERLGCVLKKNDTTRIK